MKQRNGGRKNNTFKWLQSEWGAVSLRMTFILGLFFLVFAPVLFGLKWSQALAQIIGTQRLKGHVPAAVSKAPMVGDLPNATKLHLAIGLPLRNQQVLQKTLKALYDPTNPQYRKFFKPEQFIAQFGPTKEDYQKVIDFVKSQGLSVVQTHSDRTMLEVVGTVDIVQKAFHVRLHNYKRKDGSLFRSPDNEPEIDSNLPISHIAGLNDYNQPHNWLGPRSTTRQPAPKSASSASSLPKTNFGSGPNSNFNPYGPTYVGIDLRHAYSLPDNINYSGRGQTIALFEPEGYFNADIASYQSNFMGNYTTTIFPGLTLPAPLVVPVQNGPSINLANNNGLNPSGGNGEGEVALDIEMVMAMAPGAQIAVYEGPDTDNYNGNGNAYDVICDAILGEIANPTQGEYLPNQISCSWYGFGDSLTNTYLSEMAADGQAFFMAAGDTGAYVSDDFFSFFYGTTPPLPYNDASGEVAWMTLVGGTQLNTTGTGGSLGTYSNEITWNDPALLSFFSPFYPPRQAAGGGGICSNVPLPSWQSGFINVQNNGDANHRNMPDVSCIAENLTDFDSYIDFNTNIVHYDQSEPGVSGTSASAPLWASFWSIVNEQAQAMGQSPLGFANPSLYWIGQDPTKYPNDFHDVVTNNNNDPYPPTAYGGPANNPNQFSAVTGYDLATGLGSPNGLNLINDLTGNVATPTPGCCVALKVYGNGVAGTAPWQFNSPMGVAFANSKIYVADVNNSRINMMTKVSGAPIGSVANTSGFAFFSPRRIAADGEAIPHLFVVDSTANRVFIIDTSTNSVVNSFTGAPMSDPEGVCVNSTGTTVVVSENAPERIRVFTTTGNPATGSYSVLTSLTVPANYHPVGLTMDSVGNVFATVTLGGPTGSEIIKYNYIPTIGYNPASVVLINSASQPLNNPNDIALDSTGKMYVVNTVGNYQVYDSLGNLLNYCSSGAGLALNTPQGINLDTGGNVFVGDTSNNRVVEFAQCTPTPTATPTPGCCVVQQTYGNGTAGSSPWQFNHAIGSALVGNTLYVADTSNRRISMMNQSTGFPMGFVSNSSGFAFQNPRRIAIDGVAPNPHLFVVDSMANRVFVINTSTNSVVNNFTANPISDPEGICVNAAGTTVVMSENAGKRIRVFTAPNPTGNFTLLTTLNMPGGPGLAPIGLTMDSVGNVFAAITGSSHEIVKYNYQPGLGYNPAPLVIMNNPVGHLNNPNDLVVDNAGKIYVVNSGGSYEIFDSLGNFLQSCPVAYPEGISMGPNGNLYIGDTSLNQVLMYAQCTPTPTPTPVPGCCVVLKTYGNGTAGSSPWQLNTPMGVAQSGSNLYIVEPNNSRINIMNQATGTSVGFVANPTGFPFNVPRRIVADGEAAPHLFMVDNGATRIYIIDTTTNSVINSFTGPSMNDPEGVCVNSDGTTVVVSENAGHKIRVFAANTNNLNLATYSVVQTLTPPGGGIVFAPLGMRMNAAGDVFVANPGGPSTSNAILKYKYAYMPTPGYSTAAPTVWQNATHLNGPMDITLDYFGKMYVVNGGGNYEVYDPSGNFTGTTCSGLNSPNGINLDPSGNLYIGDSSNNRVVMFAQCTPTPVQGCCQFAGAPWASPTPISGAQQGLAVDTVRNWVCVASTGSPNGAINVYQAYDGQFVETISSPLLTSAWVVAAGPTSMYVGCRDGSICSVNLLTKQVVRVTASAGAARGIFVDPSGNIYETTDDTGGTNKIYVVTSGGTVSTITPGNIGGTGIPLSNPSGILKIGNGAGTLYVSDPVNHRMVSLGLSNYNTYTVGSSAVVFSGGVNGPNNPSQLALFGNSQTGNFYVGSQDGGYWYYKNQNPGWSVQSPKSCTGGPFTSFGIVFGTAVDVGGDIFIMNQNGAINKILPCTSGAGQPSSPRPLVGANSLEGVAATSTPIPKSTITSVTPTPTLTPTPTPTPELRLNGSLVIAVPNVSRGGEPILFFVNLVNPAKMDLNLFNISGEKIFEETSQGNAGVNTLNWGLSNQSGSPIASGLYIYVLTADDGVAPRTQRGKVVVIR